MPKIGMKPLRKQQLIDATLDSVAQFGLQNTTIITISRIAGLSSGIISHYFGGKQQLVEATVKHLLEQLKLALLERVRGQHLEAADRLMMIIEANFTQLQRSKPATKTWLSFWAQSMHEPGLARLQNINSKRLHSNLLFSFRQLLNDDLALIATKQAAAMIDGFWLRSALSPSPEEEFRQAEQFCKKFIVDLLKQYGEVSCH
ncbi:MULTISPECIES: transcriptional regulator BetI [unclassified Colwellia]|uniref:transcriptional regulator BetI n=1 Tax=unclassified Colwellia TaxID=196834 RepID=UPI0015F63D56|nr:MULTISPECIES: transcriptional regulator BetI [unclassified Colwellia]MBA6250910.1 transcriptional regulator BetI [Colwellia sp. MB3u-55]MBA6399503.1 transcriptional regulator BetI [Colwellia sp. BRX10-4]